MGPAQQGEATFGYRCVCGEPMVIDPIYAGRLVVCGRCNTPVLLPVNDGDPAAELKPELHLRTQRLRLDPARRDDAKMLLPITSDAENYSYETSQPDTPRSLRLSLSQSRFPAGFRKYLTLRFVATRDCDNEAIGLLHLQLERDHLTASLGIMIHHPFQGMGFGGECVDAAVRFCFNTLKLFRLSAACDPKNEASVQLFRSAGFDEEGCLRQWMRHPQRGWIDCKLFAKFPSGEGLRNPP